MLSTVYQVSFVFNDADENFLMIMFALAYRDLVCFITSVKPELMMCSRHLQLSVYGNVVPQS